LFKGLHRQTCLSRTRPVKPRNNRPPKPEKFSSTTDGHGWTPIEKVQNG
jgi:hypothetical protein